MTQRPLSPHLQTYKLPMLPVVSILNRVAGVALAFGILALSAWLIALGMGAQAYAWVTGILTSPLGLIALVGWSFALFWHAANGLRHLAWDMGYGFDIRTAERTAYAVIVFSIIATLAFWLIIWGQA